MFVPRFPFSFGFKPGVGGTARIVSDWDLSSEHSLLMHVRRGDTLRVDRGTVWLGADVSPAPVELGEGAAYTARHDGVLRLTGTDRPRVTVHSLEPLKVCTRADYGGWRFQAPLVRTRRALGGA